MGIFDALKRSCNPSASPAPAAYTPPEKETFTFSALPESLSQMQALPEASLETPFQAAALTVCALCAYAAAPEIGIEMLNFLKGPQPLTPYELQFLRDRFSDKKYVPFSYFEGTSPDNNYTPSEPFRITIFATPYSFTEDGYAKLTIRSSGADSPREVKLRRKGAQWFLWEQFLLPGIRIPKADDPWA